MPNPISVLDCTPPALRRLLPDSLLRLDAGSLLVILEHCRILQHFIGGSVYRTGEQAHLEQAQAHSRSEIWVGGGMLAQPAVFLVIGWSSEAKADPKITPNLLATLVENYPRCLLRAIAARPVSDKAVELFEFAAVDGSGNAITCINNSVYQLQRSQAQSEQMLTWRASDQSLAH